VRAAEGHRQAEPLGAAHRDVRAQLPRRAQQGQREQVGRHGGQGAAGRGRPNQRGQVGHGAGGPRVLQQHAEQVTVSGRGDRLRGEVGDGQLDAERFGPGLEDLDGLRQAVLVDQEHVALAGHPPGHGHRLGRRGGLVQ
jgi:hypothetical protein